MNKVLLILFTLSVGTFSTSAQLNTPIFRPDSNQLKHSIGVSISYLNTLNTTLSYHRITSIKNKPICLDLEVSSPLMILSSRNKIVNIGANLFLLNSAFNVKALMRVKEGFYEDVMAKGNYLDLSVGIFPGFYRKNFFVSTEFMYENNVFTTYNFKELNPVTNRKVVSYNSSGDFSVGISGGIAIKNRIELKTRVNYSISRDFKNYSPYTRNIGVQIALNYRFKIKTN